MNLHTLKPAKGSVKNSKRIGRGTGSGRGGTSTRGHKGDKARSGYKEKRNFEGGQMPLQMRLPKRGFTPLNKITYATLNLSKLQQIADKYQTTDLSFANLLSLGIVRKNEKVKILGGGALTAVINVSGHAISETAKQKVEKLGGKFILI
ncbi:MAG: 50S ribosomal protein L15 [Saprospiraceae bacterium]|nr:50S ribosomal protein L15 [Saprospiraceae bacterium]